MTVYKSWIVPSMLKREARERERDSAHAVKVSFHSSVSYGNEKGMGKKKEFGQIGWDKLISTCTGQTCFTLTFTFK